MLERPNVAFAGLTAAGKTTHAKILAEQLDYEYVSATEIFLEILGIQESADKIWLSHYDMIERTRNVSDADLVLSAALDEIANTKQGVVFDTWALAWTSAQPMIRLWLESDLESRARKCFVSQGPQKKLGIAAAREHVKLKDDSTREKFTRWFRFDLYSDHEIFDIIVDNSELIPEPTEESAQRGIEQFAPVIGDLVAYQLNVMQGSIDPSEQAEVANGLLNKHHEYIIRLR